MDSEYINIVKSRFDESALKYESEDKLIFYEEFFKWQWLATKLKIFSFIDLRPSVDVREIKRYSEDCFKYAKKNKEGIFPVGFQNGVVSFSVLAADAVSTEAAIFAAARPKRHFAAFENPVIVELPKKKVYCYTGGVIWGSIYQPFFREYIIEHFTFYRNKTL